MNLFRNLAACLLLIGSAHAQNVSYDAVKLADIFVDSSWQSLEQTLPVLFSGLETQFKAGGATDNASKVLTEESRRSFTKENFSRAIAGALTEKFSPDELKELSGFVQSNLGKKYLQLNKDLSNDPRYIAPILKQACDAAKSKLGLFERGSINGVCGNF